MSVLDAEEEYRAIMVKVFELAERLTGDDTDWLTVETAKDVDAIASRLAWALGVNAENVVIE